MRVTKTELIMAQLLPTITDLGKVYMRHRPDSQLVVDDPLSDETGFVLGLHKIYMKLFNDFMSGAETILGEDCALLTCHLLVLEHCPDSTQKSVGTRLRNAILWDEHCEDLALVDTAIANVLGIPIDLEEDEG